MSVKKLNPYLLFNGTAEKAIALYESALGAKAENISRYGEMPGMTVPDAQKNLIMHTVLNIGEEIVMLSDASPDRPVPADSNVHVVLEYTDVQEMTKAFDALSTGGKVTQPLQDTFWGARFGMLTDAYGIHWMLNCKLK